MPLRKPSYRVHRIAQPKITKAILRTKYTTPITTRQRPLTLWILSGGLIYFSIPAIKSNRMTTPYRNRNPVSNWLKPYTKKCLMCDDKVYHDGSAYWTLCLRHLQQTQLGPFRKRNRQADSGVYPQFVKIELASCSCFTAQF